MRAAADRLVAGFEGTGRPGMSPAPSWAGPAWRSWLSLESGLARAPPCDTEPAVRFFNRAGPIVPERHYCIHPLDRVDLDQTLTLIWQTAHFVLYAPRQTGKTSTLLALADRLNSVGEYRCVHANFEAGHTAREDTGRAMRTLLGELGSGALPALQDNFVDTAMSELLEKFGPDGALKEILIRWSAADPKPLVLLID